MEETVLMMVYGTLMKGFHNHVLLKNCKFVSNCETKEKYRLQASGIPFVNSNHAHSHIKGELYEVPVSELPNIDRLEGHPDWYKRRKTTVLDENNEEKTAWLYFFDQVKDNVPVVESGDYRTLKK